MSLVRFVVCCMLLVLFVDVKCDCCLLRGSLLRFSLVDVVVGCDVAFVVVCLLFVVGLCV